MLLIRCFAAAFLAGTGVMAFGKDVDDAPPFDVFKIPAGLVTAPERLLTMFGRSKECFPYTANNCFQLAQECYRSGKVEDAIALLNHAVLQDQQSVYYYLKAMAELRAGRREESLASVRAVLDAEAAGRVGGLDVAKERYNGPVRTEIDELLRFATAQRSVRAQKDMQGSRQR
jgi:hypothetical protein